MSYTSSYTINLAEYLVKSHKVTLRAFYKCGVNNNYNALVVQETDEFAGTFDEVVIKRVHIKKLMTSLMRRVYVNGQFDRQFLEEIAPGLVLSPTLKTTEGEILKCLRITQGVSPAAQSQEPSPRVHLVNIPYIHAMGLMINLLCRVNFVDHVIPLPAESETLQFYGVRATGEYMPWAYYLNRNSATVNESGMTILPPPSPITIKDDPETHDNETDNSLNSNAMEIDMDYSPVSPPASSQGNDDNSELDSSRATSQDSSRAASQDSSRDTSQDSPRSPSPANPRSPSQTSPRSPSPESPSATSQGNTSVSMSTPCHSPLSIPSTSSPFISHTPRLDALLVARSDREQQGPHHLEEFVRPRPKTDPACRYMVYRAYRQKIEDFGFSPYNDVHVEEAKKFLAARQNEILNCINDTLDEAGYILNRLTKGGLAALIAERHQGSAAARALQFLNDPDNINTEIVAPELELMALYNHSLRLYCV